MLLGRQVSAARVWAATDGVARERAAKDWAASVRTARDWAARGRTAKVVNKFVNIEIERPYRVCGSTDR